MEDKQQNVIVSPSLIYQGDFSDPLPEGFDRIYMHLLKDDNARDEVLPCCSGDAEIDDLLIQASQMYEASREDDQNDEIIDNVLLQASQEVESQLVKFQVKSSPSPGSINTRFSSPKSASEVEKVRASAIPYKTKQNTEWAEKAWFSLAMQRVKNLSTEEIESGYKLEAAFASMSVVAMNYWLGRFILEARAISGKEYSPDSVYQLCCGLQRSLRNADCGDINLFEDSNFTEFRGVLDGKLKQLNRTGKYVEKKKAGVITVEMEEKLWESGMLGDHNPQVLVDTVLYLIGLSFALRSGEEHRRLRHFPSQIFVVKTEGTAPYIMYCEDVSKTHQGGLKSRKMAPKRVIHHANMQNPSRCLVQLFLKYNALCPRERPNGALYLTPLKNPTQDCWYSRVPIGHNKLSETIPRLMRDA